MPRYDLDRAIFKFWTTTWEARVVDGYLSLRTATYRNPLLVIDVTCQSFVNDTRWHYMKDDRIKIVRERDAREINDDPIATYVTVVM